jgi:hypothetical protein
MKENEQTQESHPDNSVLVAIGQLRKGKCTQALSDAMNRVIEAVTLTGKTGKVNLTLEVSLPAKGAADQVLIKDNVTSKVPEIDKGASFFFVDKTGRLCREDPSGQQDMFRKGASDPTENHEQTDDLQRQANG